jgi:hypothetical protein
VESGHPNPLGEPLFMLLFVASVAHAEPVTCQTLKDWVAADLPVPLILKSIVQEGVPPAEMECIQAAGLPNTVVYAASVTPLGAKYAPPRPVLEEPPDRNYDDDRYDDPSLISPRSQRRAKYSSGKRLMIAGGVLAVSSSAFTIAASYGDPASAKDWENRLLLQKTGAVVAGAGGLMFVIGVRQAFPRGDGAVY